MSSDAQPRLDEASAIRTILLVEDDPAFRKLLRLTCEQGGFRVLEAENGRIAEEQLLKEGPDLVLQDLMLPDIDGFTLVRRLRAIPAGANIPIIAVSASLMRVEHARDLTTGFTDYLLKPVTPSHILKVIDWYLPRRGPVREPAHAGQRLLVVDDDESQLKMMRLVFERAGFEVKTVSDGTEALFEARRSSPDIIVSDVTMPELDGYRFCLALRRDPQLASIPVVLTSGIRVSPADQDLARKVGAQALVPRTPGFREVLDTVAALRRLPTGSPRSASGKPAITDAGGLDAAEIDRATVGMFRLTPDGRPIAVNPALALILDYAGPEELMAAWSAFPDILVDRERGQEFLRGCNDPEGISGFEADARTRAGRVIRIVARGRALRDEDGLPCWLQCVVEDITTSNPVE